MSSNNMIVDAILELYWRTLLNLVMLSEVLCLKAM